MSNGFWTLRAGNTLKFNGEVWEVVSMSRDHVTIRNYADEHKSVSHAEIFRRARPAGLLDPPIAAGPGAAELSLLSDDDLFALELIEQELQEMLTGYRSGSSDDARPWEPRPEYLPSVSKMARYQAKANELGLGVSTVRDYLRRWQRAGLAGLIDGRIVKQRHPFGRADERWIDCASSVLRDNESGPKLPRIVLYELVDEEFVDRYHCEPPVGSWQKRNVLDVLASKRAILDGRTRTKRSNAARPASTGNGLKARRPGEIIQLDSTRLDIFAMDAITGRWVSLELTVAIDVATRCVLGVRLAETTKAVDIATLLFEVISPDSKALTGVGLLPYAGLPRLVQVPHDDEPDEVLVEVENDEVAAGLPGVTPDQILIDHGKVFVSNNTESVCRKLGVSVQRARLRTGADKGIVERFFGTVNTSFLPTLPGYKGPDLMARGEAPEKKAFWFIDEIERMFRDWVAEIYHPRKHSGLFVRGGNISPIDAFEVFSAESGRVDFPIEPGLVFDFLPIFWCTIRHDGVKFDGCRYNGPGFQGCRDKKSKYTGKHAGKWPLYRDPDDISRAYFFNYLEPEIGWTSVKWDHADLFDGPVSEEQRAYALKKYRAEHNGEVNEREALRLIRRRWKARLQESAEERRMVARTERQLTARLQLEARLEADEDTIATSVARDQFAIPEKKRPGALRLVETNLPDLD